MPYPSEPPTLLHDLFCPNLPPASTSLLGALGFASSAAMFEALGSEVRHSSFSRLATVYSYPDAPTPPPSRGLMVIGVADASSSVVRKLPNDPEYLHKCTIAVKRADGKYGRQLKAEEISNSHGFATFLRRLREEGLVAILGKDRLGRFGILKPTEDMGLDSEFKSQDFVAVCLVGEIDAVSCHLEVLHSNHVPTAATKESSLGPNIARREAVQVDRATTSGRKRKAEDKEPNRFHADEDANANDGHYSPIVRSLNTRAKSRIFHLRAFQNWIKSTQIQEVDPFTKYAGWKTSRGPLRVLDLACGKGGDLGKWTKHARGISNYVGIDAARGSLKDAALRARQMRKKLTKCAVTFTCADLGADVPGRFKSPSHKRMQELPTWSLENDDDGPLSTEAEPEFRPQIGGGVGCQERFDVVSIQMAIHYVMRTKMRARRFIRTVSELLEVGGNLIVTTIDARVVLAHLMNLGLDLHSKHLDQEATIKVGGEACQLVFSPETLKRIFHPDQANTNEDEHLFGLRYKFILGDGEGVDDSVNLSEYLAPIPLLKSLAEEVGLEMEYAHNFHNYFGIRKDPAGHAAEHSSLRDMKVVNRRGSVSREEWEISRLYAALKFRKVREPPPMSAADEDAEKVTEGPEAEDEIDPMIKARLLPMAMMKAKKVAGDEAWKRLSSEEKKRLTVVELLKLAKK